MATRKARSGTQSLAASGKEISVKPVLDVSEDSGFVYANHAEVGHSRHEFFVLFAKIPSKIPRSRLEIVKASGELHFDASVQLVIPPSLIGGLIKALSDQRAKYEKEFGPIMDTWKGKVGERE